MALEADRVRIWEVRRFCQILPCIIQHDRGEDLGQQKRSGSGPNGALVALLRRVINQLDADLAMVSLLSLLNDHTQYVVRRKSV